MGEGRLQPAGGKSAQGPSPRPSPRGRGRKEGWATGIRIGIAAHEWQRTIMTASRKQDLYQRIRQILDSARANVVRSVNTTHVYANWLIGREIVEEEQRGKRRAGYGKRLIEELSLKLRANYGSGYSVQSLWLIRQFYLMYPQLLQTGHIPHALRRELSWRSSRSNSEILHAPRRESWKPDQLHPNLSWTHYRTLLRVETPAARSFYELEGIKNKCLPGLATRP